MNEPNIVILAGGISSRMKKSAAVARAIETSLVDDAAHKSKSMIGVGSGHRPFLDYLLLNVQASGYRDVVLLIGEADESVRQYYDPVRMKRGFPELTITFVVQPIPDGRTKPLGTADAVTRSLEATPRWKRAQFTVCNSDNLYTQHALKLLLESKESNATIAYDRDALGFAQERIAQFGIMKTDEEDFLVDILEKPTPRELEEAGITGIPAVSMNIFRFTYDDILPFVRETPLHPVRQEKELPVSVKRMIQRHARSMKTFRLAEVVPDLTTVDDIPIVQQYLLSHFSEASFR
jgi:glucose-1-phosphate thymidylyltransferase